MRLAALALTGALVLVAGVANASPLVPVTSAPPVGTSVELAKWKGAKWRGDRGHHYGWTRRRHYGWTRGRHVGWPYSRSRRVYY